MNSDNEDEELRKQLREACANVRRQIESQDVSRGYAPGLAGRESGSTLAIRALESELAQLEEALANLEPDAADSP
jgi:hypothetical protein